MNRKHLPIGIQTFSEIRQENHYYVDKSGLMLDLIRDGKCYFLSRPRRFGKSLLVDTFKELFEGNRALFTELKAEHAWDWSQTYPVLRLDFSEGVLHRIADFEPLVHTQLLALEQQHELPARFEDRRSRFKDIIIRLHQKVGQRVVVLIDEYDKPILDNITDSPVAIDLREALKDLYSVLKGCDAHLKFVFITGVSKFSKVSLFSGLNNLRDITLDARYSALCGYTDHDIDTVFAAEFAPELPELDREHIRYWYNGYNWCGEGVYNPFDLLLLFDSRSFRPYWFETGTPTFLIKLLQERHIFAPELGQQMTSAQLLSTFDVDNIPTEALMFQAGYLTIDREDNQDGDVSYTLRFPNHEVEQSLNESLLLALSQSGSSTTKNRQILRRCLVARDFDGLKTLFQAFFSSIPYQWYTNNRVACYEGYYASVFYCYFVAAGMDVQAEASSNAGRLDMRVRYQGQIYLFEFKVVELAADGSALQQIKQRGYADAYRAEGLPIHLIGVEFSKDSRNVVGFEVESILSELMA